MAGALVVVVGSINMDLVARVVRLPRPGETVSASDVRYIPGGKGANQAVAAARLGARSAIIGRVGDDAFADRLIQSLTLAGVDASHVTATDNCSSGIALIGVEQSGENAITIASGANSRLSPDDVKRHEAMIASAGAVLVQLEVPVETVAAALELARRHKVLTILDPAPAPRQSLPKAVFEVDIISPNQTEAQCLTGIAVTTIEQAEDSAKKLRERGSRNVVMKLGHQGALVLDADGRTTHIPAPAVEVLDTTAAGDAFTAAMTVAFAGGTSLVEAVQFACVTGAIAVTKLGAQQSMPSLEEVKSRIDHGRPQTITAE
jgi:ribokinase